MCSYFGEGKDKGFFYTSANQLVGGGGVGRAYDFNVVKVVVVSFWELNFKRKVIFLKKIIYDTFFEGRMLWGWATIYRGRTIKFSI